MTNKFDSAERSFQSSGYTNSTIVRLNVYCVQLTNGLDSGIVRQHNPLCRRNHTKKEAQLYPEGLLAFVILSSQDGSYITKE